MSHVVYLYILKAALRDKIVRVISAVFILIAALSAFMGGAAILESHSFTLVFAASSLRLSAVLGIILFVSFYIQRSIASKDLDFILSRPISREKYVLSCFAAFATLSLFLTFMAFIAIFVLAWGQVSLGLFCWLTGLFVEIALMATVAMFFSMMLASPIASFAASFGFYILSRMSGAIFGTIDGQDQLFLFNVLERIMEFISIILPRFDLIMQSDWLLYGMENALSNFIYSVVVAIAFASLIVIASMIDLKRKEF